MPVQDTALIDAALSELELRCSLGVTPGTPLREEHAILVHAAAVRLGEVCEYTHFDYTSSARIQLLEKVQLPRRLGNICSTMMQHDQLRTLGGTLLGPLITLGTMAPPASRGTAFEIMFSTQLAKSGLLAEVPKLVAASAEKLEAALQGTPLTVEVIVPAATGAASSSSRRRSAHAAAASNSSGSGSSAPAMSSHLASQHEAACFGLVSNLLQFVECLHSVWPGNLLSSADAGPNFKPAAQLAIAAVRYGNQQLQQMDEKDQIPSINLYRMLYSAFRLCPCLCAVLARHGARMGHPGGGSASVVPVAADLMGSSSFRQCALLYMTLQTQTQLVAPLYGWQSSADKAYPTRRSTRAAAPKSRPGASSSSSRGSSSGGGGNGRGRRGSQSGRAGQQSNTMPSEIPISGVALEAWNLARAQQQPELLPSHEQLLSLLGVSRLLLLWLGMAICLDEAQPSLQHAVLQQTLLVEVLDVYRSCWQPQLATSLPLPEEVQQLQLLPNMLLQWVNGLKLPLDSEDYIFCAIGAAFSSRFALRTWMVARFLHTAAVDPETDSGQESAGTTAQQQEQQQPAADSDGSIVDDACFDELVPELVLLLQRLVPQVQSGTALIPSTTLAPAGYDPRGPVTARTAAEAIKQVFEVFCWLGSTSPPLSDNWRRIAVDLMVLQEAYGRADAAGPLRDRAKTLLGTLRSLYVHDVIPRGVSSFVLSGPLLQLSMAMGPGSQHQALLYGLLSTSLKLSHSFLPEQQCAYLELVSSISAAGQAVLCSLYEDALGDRPDATRAAAAPAAILPWVSMLGRCLKQISALIDLLLQCKLTQMPMWPPGDTALPPGAPLNLALWLYMTASTVCTRLLHLLLTLLSPLAIDLPEPKGSAQAELTEEQKQQLQRQQEQYLLQLSPSATKQREKQQQQAATQEHQVQQQEQQQQQQPEQDDAGQGQGLDQAAGSQQKGAQTQQQLGQDAQVLQNQSQQQPQQEQEQQQEGSQQPVVEQQQPVQQHQEQDVVPMPPSSRQRVWDAAAAVGADVKHIADVLQSAYSATIAADAALQKYFEPAALMQLMQPLALPDPQDGAPAGAVAAADASAGSGTGGAAAAVPAAGGDAAGGAPSSSTAGRPVVVPAAALMAFAEDETVQQLVPALQAIGVALSTLPTSMACNNPSCISLVKDSEQQMVGGRGCLCAGCKLARYCGKQCHVAHWKVHKAVCKAVAKQLQEQESQQQQQQQ